MVYKTNGQCKQFPAESVYFLTKILQHFLSQCFLTFPKHHHLSNFCHLSNIYLCHSTYILVLKQKENFQNVTRALGVLTPLGCKYLTKETEFSFSASRQVSECAITRCCCLVCTRLWQGWWWWGECEKECIEHTNNLAEAGSQVGVFNPTWLYDKC